MFLLFYVISARDLQKDLERSLSLSHSFYGKRLLANLVVYKIEVKERRRTLIKIDVYRSVKLQFHSRKPVPRNVFAQGTRFCIVNLITG